MSIKEFWEKFLAALLRLATSRKFIVALTAFLGVLSQYLGGVVTLEFTMQSLIALAITIIITIAGEDMAQSVGGK